MRNGAMGRIFGWGRALALAVLLLASSAALGAAKAPGAPPADEAAFPFKLGWLGDGLALESVLSLYLAGGILESSLPPKVWDGTVPALSAVNPLDRPFVRPPSASWGMVGDVTGHVLGFAPALFLLEGFDNNEELLTTATMYAEAGLLAVSLTKILKNLVPRLRPYVYTEEGREAIAGEDYFRSFPSGHATTAFVGASFCSYTYARLHPGSPLRIPVAIVSYGLACFCGVSRVVAGMHFPTDVLAGALIGTLSGIVVPYFHLAKGRKPEGKGKVQALAIPNGIAVRIGF